MQFDAITEANTLPNYNEQGVLCSKDLLECSIVIPCLNESDTIQECVRAALMVSDEVIVADNGSTDNSQALARIAGARVVTVQHKGYGNALRAGIESARGVFVVFADADGSYDFSESSKLFELLKNNDLVQGVRQVEPRAMPILHRYIGNPIFSFLSRLLFKTNSHDIYCGMKGVSRDRFIQLGTVCDGMEFNCELTIKATKQGLRIAEVPVTLKKDGRKKCRKHLRTVRDGLRTLKLFMNEKWNPKGLLAGLVFIIIAASIWSVYTVLRWMFAKHSNDPDQRPAK